MIRHLQEQGLLCADHALRGKDNIVIVLSEAEIALLKEAGVAVDIRAPLDCPTPNSGYLDAPGIDAAFAKLKVKFPALTELTENRIIGRARLAAEDVADALERAGILVSVGRSGRAFTAGASLP